MTAWISRRRRTAILALVLVMAMVAAAPMIRRAVETAGALRAIAQVGGQASADRAAHRNRISRVPGRQVSYLVDGRFRTADLYLSDVAPRASLILVPGADALGREHPQFRALAAVLSDMGFAVLVPHMENLQRLRIRAGDVTQIADAARHMARFAPRNSGPSVGVLAVSYAVGPAILAALDEKAGPYIRFILGIGGYYDLESALTFFTTGYFRAEPDDDWQTAVPLAHGKWVFLASNTEFLKNPQDRVTLRLIAKRKFADARADVSDLTPMLSPQGRAVFELITNQDPARVSKLIGELPQAALDHFRALDLANADFSKLRARLILVHGRDDRLIPFTESQSLARAAKNSPGGVQLYVIDEMGHMHLSPSSLGDALKLFRAVYELLEQRDFAPEPTIPPALAKPLDLTGVGSEDAASAQTVHSQGRNP